MWRGGRRMLRIRGGREGGWRGGFLGGFGLGGRGTGSIDVGHHGVHTIEHFAGVIFVGAESEEGNQGGEDPDFGAGGNFGFRLPTENTAGDFESDEQAEDERDGFGEEFGGDDQIGGGTLQADGKISGRGK